MPYGNQWILSVFTSHAMLTDSTQNTSMTNKLQNQQKLYCHLERGIV